MPSLWYLTHPKHGTHICYDWPDVEKHFAQGWALREEKQAEISQPPKKRGRPKVKKDGD